MMDDITLIVIPDATSAVRLLGNPWPPAAQDVDSDADGQCMQNKPQTED